MRKVILIVIVILLASCNVVRKDYNLQFSINKIPIVKVVIYKDTINMIVDSGASISFIDTDFYRGRTEIYGEVVSIKGNIDNIYISEYIKTEIDSLEFNHKYLLKDFKTLSKQLKTPIKGIIGSDILHKYYAKIDYRNKTINLIK